MVELIVGKKGKGKTKVLLDKVNGAIKEANGSIVYLDKSTKHMYELNNKVRLIDVSVYPIKNADEFVGFVCGIISQDHDLEQVYQILKLVLQKSSPFFLSANQSSLFSKLRTIQWLHRTL